MAAQPVSDVEIWQTHAYFASPRASVVPGEDSQARERREIKVPAESILASSEKPHEWLTYAGNYGGHRHSALSQISRKTVGDLRVAWIAQLQIRRRMARSVADRRWAVSFSSPSHPMASSHSMHEPVRKFGSSAGLFRPTSSYVADRLNRGAAILGDTLFVATLDAHLVALDAATGRKKWETRVAEHREGYAMTGAPLALGDRVLVGVAGSEYGIRGFVAAFSAIDGRMLWKFHTDTRPGEPGHESWAGESWRIGGAATWTTGAYDPKLDLVYWGVGNPAPLHQGDVRAGDNLFANSVIALDAKSGKLRWHFQFTPADEHDWDAVQQPVLARIEWQGEQRAALLWANRNGFFYALDRETGKFLFAKPFVKQTLGCRLRAERPADPSSGGETDTDRQPRMAVDGRGHELVAALLRRWATIAIRAYGRCSRHLFPRRPGSV